MAPMISRNEFGHFTFHVNSSVVNDMYRYIVKHIANNVDTIMNPTHVVWVNDCSKIPYVYNIPAIYLGTIYLKSIPRALHIVLCKETILGFIPKIGISFTDRIDDLYLTVALCNYMNNYTAIHNKIRDFLISEKEKKEMMEKQEIQNLKNMTREQILEYLEEHTGKVKMEGFEIYTVDDISYFTTKIYLPNSKMFLLPHNGAGTIMDNIYNETTIVFCISDKKMKTIDVKKISEINVIM